MAATKPAPVTKKEKKKEKAMNALFAGVSSNQKESSSEEEEVKELKRIEKPVEQAKPQQQVEDLLSWDAPATTQQTAQVDVLGMFGGSSQPV